MPGPVDEFMSSRGRHGGRGDPETLALFAHFGLLDCFGAMPLAVTLRNYSAGFRITGFRTALFHMGRSWPYLKRTGTYGKRS
jgi:hypothetical protein